jgi:hypothetical protein
VLQKGPTLRRVGEGWATHKFKIKGKTWLAATTLLLRVAHPSWFWKGGAFDFARVGLGKKEILRRVAPQDDGQKRFGDEATIIVTANDLFRQADLAH